MKKLLFTILVTGLAFATVAMAQNPGVLAIKPSVRAAAAKLTPKMPMKTDLVIDAVEWVYSGPRAERHSTGMILKSPKLMVTLRNAGTERWASSGEVGVRVDMGEPDDRAARRTGTSVVPSSAPTPGIMVGVPAPFNGNATIPGSLAPGEKRTVEITLKGRGANPHASEHLMIMLDKYYTAHVTIQSRGDDQPNNNRADLVFRLNVSGSTIDPVLTQRVSDPATSGGTVEVRAPGGS